MYVHGIILVNPSSVERIVWGGPTLRWERGGGVVPTARMLLVLILDATCGSDWWVQPCPLLLHRAFVAIRPPFSRSRCVALVVGEIRRDTRAKRSGGGEVSSIPREDADDAAQKR